MYSGPEASSDSDTSIVYKRRKTSSTSGTESGTSRRGDSILNLDMNPQYLNILRPDAKMVVAIDFGTTYSGFAFALPSEIEKVYLFYEWPATGQLINEFESKPYCKTQTSLWYMPAGANRYELKEWGSKAIWKYKRALQNSRKSGSNSDHAEEFKSSGYLATKFKLHLAPTSSLGNQMLSISPLPAGLTAKRLISDYLACLCDFIMDKVHNSYGNFISKKDVQWCLSVPAIWDDAAKQQMVECAEIAGLVKGPLCHDRFASPHSLIVVLEPEAASLYCRRKLKEVDFIKGSKFLVVDVGGGTVDLVVHEKVDDSDFKVKEIACPTGDLCGSTYVDEAFYRFIAQKISCFEEFSSTYPTIVLKMQGYIEKVKRSFDGESESFADSIQVPPNLAKAWESYDTEKGWWRGAGMYDSLTISKDDLISIFSGVVERILELIGDQLDANPKLGTILVVGGFSSSPHLMRKIRERFSGTVDRILNPVDPGSAVCQGAVAFGDMDAEIFLSRKSKKTYGIASCRAYRMEDPRDKLYITKDGRTWCKDTFHMFVKKGDDVPIDHSVKHEFCPFEKTDTSIVFDMYATNDARPSYTTDKGMELVGSWTYPIPLRVQKMNEFPLIAVEMFFGKAMIEVAANPRNFHGPDMLMAVKFERNFC